jgi:hypothetical protein
MLVPTLSWAVSQSQAKAVAQLGLAMAFRKVSEAVCYETCSTAST